MTKELVVFADVKSSLGVGPVGVLSLSDMADLIHTIDIVCIHVTLLHRVVSVQ